MTIHELEKQAVIINEHQQVQIKGGTDTNTITSQDTYIGSIDTDAF